MSGIEQKVLRFIASNKLIQPDDKILIAFSGGPDSVFALWLLKKYQKKFRIEIEAVHFNHNLRGKESDADEKFCGKFCEQYSVPLYTVQLDVKSYSKQNKISIEEAARKLRYYHLEAIRTDFDCNKIATAHNQSDNTETVLLNFITGTGYSGFTGIPVKRGNIIRPVLCLSKNEILEFLDSKKIKYRVDSSNLKNNYKRNFLRNKIIPALRDKLNPSIDDAIFRSSKTLEEGLEFVESHIKSVAKKFSKKEKGSVRIKLSLFESNGDWVSGDVLKKIFRNEFNHDFDYDDYLKIRSLTEKQKGKSVQIKTNVEVIKESDSLLIKPADTVDSGEFPIRPGEIIEIGDTVFGIEEVSKKDVMFGDKRDTEFIAGDKLDDMFILRKWKSGDKFIPLGMKKFKKISDFLTDSKIESSKRKSKLILVNRNYIVWVPGLRIDNRFKLTGSTNKIFKLWMK